MLKLWFQRYERRREKNERRQRMSFFPSIHFFSKKTEAPKQRKNRNFCFVENEKFLVFMARAN